MDGEDRNQEHDNHQHRGDRHKGASKYQQSAADLNDDGAVNGIDYNYYLKEVLNVSGQ